MILFDARTDVHRHAQGLVNALSKTIWLIVGALVPAVVTALVKGFQDRSRSQRAQQLTDRITTLSKSIAELPEGTAAGDAPVTPRQALMAELNLVVAELYLLQTKVKHSFHWVSMNAMARFRSALLLFRPRGLKATLLHTAFYVYTAVFVFCAVAVVLPSQDTSATQDASASQDTSTPQDTSATQDTAAAQGSSASPDNPAPPAGRGRRHRPAPSPENEPFLNTASIGNFLSDLAAYVLMVGVASVPMLLLRYYAVKIHRQQVQTESAQNAAGTSSPAAVTTPAGVSH